MELLCTKPRAGVALLTLNRPESLNALTLALQRALDRELASLASDEDVGAIVLTGSGRAFCAGNDIHELASMTGEELTLNELEREELIWRFAACPKPTICAVNGLTIGAGSIVAAAADLRIGCELSSFTFSSARYGGIHNTWSLPGIVGMARAKEFLYTARVVEPNEAFAVGLLNRMVNSPELSEAALDFAEEIAGNSVSVQTIKKALEESVGSTLKDSYRREARLMRLLNDGENRTPEIFARFLKDDST